jgi:tetratricopeptide (TPR) repeat protein
VKIATYPSSFAQQTIATSNLMGILFVMKIDPSISATSSANVRDISAYRTEEEILFSMHSVFRIGQVKQLDGNNRLWQVKLILTNDNDPQLYDLIKLICQEITGSTGWHRLGDLLIMLGEYNKAEKLYKILLGQTIDDNEKVNIYNPLGRNMEQQGKYTEAIRIYEKAFKISKKVFLQIILRWLLLTITSVWCITT